jgi:hypothetical protein
MGLRPSRLQSVIRQRPLQRLCLIPGRAHPHVTFFFRRQNHRHGLGVNRLDDGVRCGGKKPVNKVRSGNRFRLGPAVAFELGPESAEGEQGRSSFKAYHTTSFFPVAGFGSGAYSAKLLAGTKQRLSGFSQPRQCGEVVLRIFVTGKPPARGGGGMPHRIMTSSRSAPTFLTTGAG